SLEYNRRILEYWSMTEQDRYTAELQATIKSWTYKYSCNMFKTLQDEIIRQVEFGYEIVEENNTGFDSRLSIQNTVIYEPLFKVGGYVLYRDYHLQSRLYSSPSKQFDFGLSSSTHVPLIWGFTSDFAASASINNHGEDYWSAESMLIYEFSWGTVKAGVDFSRDGTSDVNSYHLLVQEIRF
ncbi:MAG: hypothetical protein K8S56_04010, partial [Candidatus Cloacimonetes bacterium]|nr:hypothetical protein [Candidatus Cloacimonadota bacterium]